MNIWKTLRIVLNHDEGSIGKAKYTLKIRNGTLSSHKSFFLLNQLLMKEKREMLKMKEFEREKEELKKERKVRKMKTLKTGKKRNSTNYYIFILEIYFIYKSDISMRDIQTGKKTCYAYLLNSWKGFNVNLFLNITFWKADCILLEKPVWMYVWMYV